MFSTWWPSENLATIINSALKEYYCHSNNLLFWDKILFFPRKSLHLMVCKCRDDPYAAIYTVHICTASCVHICLPASEGRLQQLYCEVHYVHLEEVCYQQQPDVYWREAGEARLRFSSSNKEINVWLDLIRSKKTQDTCWKDPLLKHMELWKCTNIVVFLLSICFVSLDDMVHYTCIMCCSLLWWRTVTFLLLTWM